MIHYKCSHDPSYCDALTSVLISTLTFFSAPKLPQKDPLVLVISKRYINGISFSNVRVNYVSMAKQILLHGGCVQLII